MHAYIHIYICVGRLHRDLSQNITRNVMSIKIEKKKKWDDGKKKEICFLYEHFRNQL